ncbi:ester cyclase [Streptomyces sp. NPDC056161]|uniref:ester cyclase n=1 Tax=Streptomyces sp. NPDC056161 TaxID=3345732 RepID=UPI0035E20DC7
MPVNTKSTRQAETVVRRFYEALSTGDTTLVDDALTADWAAVPALRTGPGADGWKAGIAHLRGVFTDLTITIEDVVVSGDLVAVRAVSRGVHTGELLGVPGTGRTVELRAADFHRLVGGRIARTWHLEDYFRGRHPDRAQVRQVAAAVETADRQPSEMAADGEGGSAPARRAALGGRQSSREETSCRRLSGC